MSKKDKLSTNKVNNNIARQFRYYHKKIYINIIDWTKEWKQILLLRELISLHELKGHPASMFHLFISHGPWSWSTLEQHKHASSVSLSVFPRSFHSYWKLESHPGRGWSSTSLSECNYPRYWRSVLNDLSRCHLHNRGMKHSSRYLIPIDICILINMNFIFKVWLFISSANIHMAFEHYISSSILNNHVSSLTRTSLSVASVAMSIALLLMT